MSLLLPKQYKAVASVVIDVKPDPVSAMIYGGISSPAFMATSQRAEPRMRNSGRVPPARQACARSRASASRRSPVRVDEGPLPG